MCPFFLVRRGGGIWLRQEGLNLHSRVQSPVSCQLDDTATRVNRSTASAFAVRLHPQSENRPGGTCAPAHAAQWRTEREDCGAPSSSEVSAAGAPKPAASRTKQSQIDPEFYIFLCIST